MAQSRKELSEMLKKTLPEIKHFYFSPPMGLQMKYPCVVYKLEGSSDRKADNINYLKHKRYSVTIIDDNPDSEFPEKLEKLSYCTFDRSYTSNNLYHFVYTLYF